MLSFAEVIPLRRLPKHLGVFDYAIPPTLRLQPGLIVAVPFCGRVIDALVWRLKAQPQVAAATLRSVLAVRGQYPALTDVQLKLLDFTADYYLQSPAVVAHAMLPSLRYLSPQSLSPLPNPSSAPHHLLVGPYPPREWLPMIRAALAGLRQVLVLCPSVSYAQAAGSALSSVLGDQVAPLHGRLTVRQQSAIWSAARTGSVSVVVGTRSAVFCPLPRLGHILVTHEHHGGHKQWDLNPRYHAFTVARHLAKVSSAELTVSSVSPSLATLALARRLGWRVQSTGSPPVSQTVVNLTHERRGGNRTPISELVAGHLDELARGGSSLGAVWLIAQRRGDTVATRCHDCGQVLRCPTCGLSLRHIRPDDATLRCPGCSTVSPVPERCPKCQGVDLRRHEQTTDGILRYLRTAYPNLRAVTFDATLRPAAVAKLAADLRRGSIRVVVGTSALPQATLPPPATAVVVSLDPWLNLPDYQATERAAQLLAELRSRSTESVIVQTTQPQHPLLQPTPSGGVAAWVEAELTSRRSLGYPPYRRLIAITISAASAAAAISTADAIARKLRSVAPPAGWQVEILGPLEPARAVVRRRARRQLVVKLAADDPAKLDAPLPDSHFTAALRQLPSSAVVDVDPDAIG